MKLKIVTIASIVLVGFLGYFLYSDLSDLSQELREGVKEETATSKPAPVKKPAPVIKKPTGEKQCCEKYYKVTYGRKPDVVSQPHWVPKDKTNYQQDPDTGRWYWKGD